MVYRAINQTRNHELAAQASRAESFIDRLVGLLGRRGLDPGEALHITPCNSIHTFFMRFPIDVLFLEADGTVVKLFSNLKPWRATSLYPKAQSVLELPAGTLKARPTEVGDVVLFETRSAHAN